MASPEDDAWRPGTWRGVAFKEHRWPPREVKARARASAKSYERAKEHRWPPREVKARARARARASAKSYERTLRPSQIQRQPSTGGWRSCCLASPPCSTWGRPAVQLPTWSSPGGRPMQGDPSGQQLQACRSSCPCSPSLQQRFEWWCLGGGSPRPPGWRTAQPQHPNERQGRSTRPHNQHLWWYTPASGGRLAAERPRLWWRSCCIWRLEGPQL